MPSCPNRFRLQHDSGIIFHWSATVGVHSGSVKNAAAKSLKYSEARFVHGPPRPLGVRSVRSMVDVFVARDGT